MKDMVSIVPIGSCPKCGRRQFLVHDTYRSLYLTDGDGTVLDSVELSHEAKGKCLNCGAEYDMLPTSFGYIALTKLRKILYDVMGYEDDEEEETIRKVDNPMAPKEK